MAMRIPRWVARILRKYKLALKIKRLNLGEYQLPTGTEYCIGTSEEVMMSVAKRKLDWLNEQSNLGYMFEKENKNG